VRWVTVMGTTGRLSGLCCSRFPPAPQPNPVKRSWNWKSGEAVKSKSYRRGEEEEERHHVCEYTWLIHARHNIRDSTRYSTRYNTPMTE
jgi:hypothetical protein